MPITCEICSKKNATTLVGFVGKDSSAAMLCDEDRDRILEQYRRLGKPGQIVLLPADSPGAEKFLAFC